MHANLTTESRNPASEQLDSLSALEIVRLMNGEDSSVAPAVGQCAEAIAAAIDVIADRLRRGGRLVYIGAGTSGRLGVLDATECPPTFSAPPEQVIGLIAGGPAALTRAVEGAEDRGESAVEDLQRVAVGSRDVVVGIATSGRTPYVVAGLEFARRAGAFSIALSCNYDSSVAALADLAITPVVGAEVLSGSTRLKAGTATKLVLNMLTTGAMVRIGKTYGNLMVDLKATNQKLRDRTRRIVQDLTGTDDRTALELLDRCGGELKTAVVAHQRNVSPDEARRLLTAAVEQLRGALAGRPTAEIAGWHDLVLGIDAGGTSTTAVLARVSPASHKPEAQARDLNAAASLAIQACVKTASDGRDLLLPYSPVGRGTACGANPLTVGWAQACAEIARAIDAAFRAAGMASRVPVAAVCIAAAGAGRPEQAERLREWAREHRVADQIVVVHDAEPVLAVGTPDAWGVAVIAGTGSFVFGRNPQGATARAGGWGPLLGDEGSAYAIAVDALRAVARAADGCGPRTELQSAMCQALDVSVPQHLASAVSAIGLDRTAVARLAPIVTQTAARSDAGAMNILAAAAHSLADQVVAVARRLELADQLFPLALAGGVLVGSEFVRNALVEQLAARGLQAGPIHVVAEPVLGAVRIAANALAKTAAE